MNAPPTPALAARLAPPVTLALQIAVLTTGALRLAQDWTNPFVWWSVGTTVLALVVLQAVRLLLPDLFARRAVKLEDARYQRFRTFFPWLIGADAALLGMFTLLLLLAPPDVSGMLTPGVLFTLLIAWAASLYASYGTYLSLARAFLQPDQAVAHVTLREWLLRSIIASVVLTVMSVNEEIRTGQAEQTLMVVKLGVTVVAAALELTLFFLIRRAVRDHARA